MRLLILGAGRNQLNAIRRAQSKGHTVIVSDYLSHAPGKVLADFAEMTSSFDIAGNIAVARKYGIDGVMTVGTDQPVLTAARVADALGLPCPINAAAALRATNKKYMKAAFKEHDLPSSRYVLIAREELDDPGSLLQKLDRLAFPLVVKPIDNQGQRGVFKLDRPGPGVIGFMGRTFLNTRAGEIIAEEFCPGDEITISAWVEDYHPYILIVTDRPLLDVRPHLGIMTAHKFPSVYLRSHWADLQDLLTRTVQGLGIAAGPIYVQVMISGPHLQLVEIACRIGGGHEDELIPLVTGIDPLDMLIDYSLGQPVDLQQLRGYNLLDNPHHAETRFIMAHPGKVQRWGSLEEIRRLPGIINAQFYYPELEEIKEIEDSSTSRWGYIIAAGRNRQELEQRVEDAYRRVEILDPAGFNLLRRT